MSFTKFLYTTVFGWKINGDFDRAIKRSVLICAPHTSYQDFLISIAARRILKVEINFVGKKELFTGAFGWFFKWMGGAPLNRGTSENKVEAISKVIQAHDEFRLAIAPEGTRNKVEKWKTGYYYIAISANVPIIPIGFDYPNKTIHIGSAFYPTGNIQNDENTLKSFYKGIIGKFPDKC